MKSYSVLSSFILLFVILLFSHPLNAQGSAKNPAAPGFNVAGSDAKAVKIADQVMQAMGSRKAWDETRFIQWNFFGRRQLIWDRWNQKVRIDMDGGKTVYLLDTGLKTGKVLRQGLEVTNPDSVRFYLDQAESIWINDSYWLLMPFKLKDSGVTLKYLGRDTIAGGIRTDRLQLTFQDVGKTPDNKYHVDVDLKSRLVVQWAYFRRFDDVQPAIVNPWTDYRRYGKILLSKGRGQRELSDIAVYSSVPESVFSSFAQPDKALFR